MTSNIALYSVLKTILYTKPCHCRCVLKTILCAKSRSYGCLERYSFSAAGLATLVSHTGVQVSGVDATVKAEAVCCKTHRTCCNISQCFTWQQHIQQVLTDVHYCVQSWPTFKPRRCLCVYMHTKHLAMHLISCQDMHTHFYSCKYYIATYWATLLWWYKMCDICSVWYIIL